MLFIYSPLDYAWARLTSPVWFLWIFVSYSPFFFYFRLILKLIVLKSFFFVFAPQFTTHIVDVYKNFSRKLWISRDLNVKQKQKKKMENNFFFNLIFQCKFNQATSPTNSTQANLNIFATQTSKPSATMFNELM